jgi:hypothetical protein
MTTDLYALLLRIQDHLTRDLELWWDVDGHARPLLADVELAVSELRCQLGPFAELRTEEPKP